MNSFPRPSMAVAAGSRFFDEITRIDRSSMSISTGIRAALVTIAPLVLGLAVGQPQWVYATLAALLVLNTEGPPATALPLRVVFLACLTEPLAFALGTLAGTTGLLAVPLVGVGIFIARLSSGDPRLAMVGTSTAIFFAVGVGLPGGSTSVAGERLWIALLGAFWALFGAWVHRSLASKWKLSTAPKTDSGSFGAWAKSYFKVPSSQSDEFRLAAAVGAASAVGLAIGLGLGFPRDFWIVVTIVAATRPRIGPTVSSSVMMVMGTIAGATIAAAITLEISDVYVLEVLLLVFGISAFATRGVNFGLVQVSLTPFIIILLNLLYPGEWYLAEIRIVDVAIGGAIAIATVYLLSIRKLIRDFRERAGGAHPSPPGSKPTDPLTRSSPPDPSDRASPE
ncbi:MAG: FUSC family protein [Nitrososphaerales archaeon]